MAEPAALADRVRSACPYCGVGCGLLMDVGDDGRITRVSGDPEHPANLGRLCTKGLTCAQPISAPGRLVSALITERGSCAASPTGLAALYPEAVR